MRKIVGSICLLIISGSILFSPISCGPRYVDRSYDPVWGFDQVVDHCFELKDDAFLFDNGSSGKDWEILPPASPASFYAEVMHMPHSMEEYYNTPISRRSWSGIKDVLPRGTKIRVTHLIQEVQESGSALPFAIIATGRHTGEKADVVSLFFDPTGVTGPNYQKWKPLEQFLVPCTCPIEAEGNPGGKSK